MNKTMKVGLLSLTIIVQVLTIIGGFIAYRQMYDLLWSYMMDYKRLLEQTGGPIIDYVPVPNPFLFLLPLVLLGLFSATVLLVDEGHHKNARN